MPLPHRFNFHGFARLLAGVGLALALTQPAFADYEQVNRLLRAGEFAQALAKADEFLSAKPKDVQMRFLKGLVLTEQGKGQDAMAVFNRLIEDYPELPEPYNNLAVIYAGQGHFEQARQLLETAVRAHPGYATAYENLGDVYAKMADQAYGKALQLDSANKAIAPKMRLIRELFAPNTTPTATPNTKVTGVRPAAAPKTNQDKGF